MTSKIYVPDEGPLDAKILFIGEAPGETEEREKRPFVGDSGQLLMSTLGRAGVSRENVRLANLCHYRPHGNKFESLIDTPQLEQGIKELNEYISKHRPNVICVLGSQALKYVTGNHSIFAWRGSIVESEVAKVKTIPTFHPAAVLRDRKLLPIFDGDIFRVIGDSEFPERRLPERKFVIDPQGLDLEYYVQLLENSEEFSVDIESTRKGDPGTKHILCIGFSPNPSLAICIVNHGDSATSNAYSRILSSAARKVMHFGTFDVEALHMNGYDTNNFTWDTLTAQHILNAELPRGLDFLTSIYTREPYYKTVGRAEIPGDTKEWGSKVDRQSLYVYNCRDASVTIEIKLEQERELTGRDREMFDYEMQLIPVGHSMTRNGLLCDIERRELFEKALYHRWNKLQVLLDLIAGRPINVRSPKLKDLLYTDFKLPVRRNRDSGITTDEDAIVSLIGVCVDNLSKLSRADAIGDWNKKLLVLKSILEIRGLRQLLSNYIKAPLSHDNRYRSTYSFSSTDTGRASCSGYIDGTGVNSQTFPRSSVDVPDNLDSVHIFDLEFDDENE